MSTKYQWLQATLFRRRSNPSKNVLTLTGLVKSSASRLKTQRAVIPAGWQTSSSHSFKTIGTLVRLLTALSLLFYYVFAVATTVSAKVFINEIFPAPDSSGEEWVELYNDSTNQQPLSYWFLTDTISTPSTIFQFTNEILEPNSYTTFSWPTNKLNNSGDAVTLFTPDGDLIGTVFYTSSQENKSWSRMGTPPNEEWQLTDPTPGKDNLVPVEPSPTPLPEPCIEPSPTPSTSPSPTATVAPSPSPSPSPTSNSAEAFDIYISEVMACPNENQLEWIEVFNTASEALSTQGWYIIDAANNKRYLLTNSEPTQLAASNFTTITFSSAFINNSSETLFLHAPDDQIVQTIDLPSCTDKGIAFTQTNGSWTQEGEQTLANESEVTTSADTTTKNTTPSPSPSIENQTIAQSGSATNPSVLGTQQRQAVQKLKLEIPKSITNTFKEPVQLLKKEPTKAPTQGIFSLVFGGILISLSTGYKLLKNMSIL